VRRVERDALNCKHKAHSPDDALLGHFKISSSLTHKKVKISSKYRLPNRITGKLHYFHENGTSVGGLSYLAVLSVKIKHWQGVHPKQNILVLRGSL